MTPEIIAKIKAEIERQRKFHEMSTQIGNDSGAALIAGRIIGLKWVLSLAN